MTIDAIIPARNEASTVADVIRACKNCRYVRDVLLVDDGSTDSTSVVGETAGARVIYSEQAKGSKAHAMQCGLDATDADSVLFVDADCLDINPSHLDAICRPYVEGRVVMSLGFFDYGPWNRIVARLPPTTGERVIPRWVFDAIPRSKLDGYTIEIMINEVIAERRLASCARIMNGVSHRTKREKFGFFPGWRLTWKMFWQLVGLLRIVRARIYWFYLRNLTVE